MSESDLSAQQFLTGRQRDRPVVLPERLSDEQVLALTLGIPEIRLFREVGSDTAGSLPHHGRSPAPAVEAGQQSYRALL